MPDLKKSKGWQYFQNTKFFRDKLLDIQPLRIGPGTEKEKKVKGKLFSLECPKEDAFVSILQKRRSVRNFTDQSLSFQEMSYLLFAAYGVTGRAGFYALKTSPSAGGLYPCQVYVQVNRVEKLSPGFYFFSPEHNSLTLYKKGDFSESMASCCLGQSFVQMAAVNIIISAIFRQNMIKYGHRGLRYILLDAGHMMQNVLLASANLNLGSCPVGAFFDDELNELMELDGQEESVVYLCSVGKLAPMET
ncbi:MAG: SagB/ThcOx family dehydrogenase [Desulfonauticus sp.]|nr:SagB/ThcOx family dehydrogenase [Desulfonauticus sp.]